MKTFRALVLVSALAISPGCSSSQDPQPTSSSGSSGTTSGSSGASGSSGDTTSGGTSGTSGSPAATAPKAPKIDQVAKMMGALHVMWTNNETACDSIIGERQAQMADGSVMEPYAVAFTVPGEADNKHDTKATADMKYTYRLRCKKGDQLSAFSNELSGNPK